MAICYANTIVETVPLYPLFHILGYMETTATPRVFHLNQWNNTLRIFNFPGFLNNDVSAWMLRLQPLDKHGKAKRLVCLS